MKNRDPTMSSSASHVQYSNINYMIAYKRFILLSMKYIIFGKRKGKD